MNPDDPFANALVKKTTTPQKPGSGSPSDPFANVLVTKTNKPHDFSDLIGDTIDNTAITLKNSLSNAISAMGQWDTLSPEGSNAQSGKQLEGIKGVYDNVVNTGQNFYNGVDKLAAHVANTPISQLSSEALDSVKSIFSSAKNGGGLAEIPSGLIKMSTDDPIGAVTSTVNNNGVATPATPQELTQKYQSVASLLVAGQVGKEVGALMAPSAANTATEAIQAANQSGLVKAGKSIGSHLVSSSAAGVAQGTIAGLGSDDNLKNAVAGAITFAPIGLAFGILGISKYNKELNETKGRLITQDNQLSAQDLAAVNSLKATSQSSFQDLAQSMSSIMETKNWVKAAILKNLKVGKGFVIEGTKDGDITPPKGAYAYHSPVSNSTAILPFKLGSGTESFFSRFGFMPREVVNLNGNDYYILKDNGAGRLVIKGINDGSEIYADPKDLRRNNTSLVSSTTKVLGDRIRSDDPSLANQEVPKVEAKPSRADRIILKGEGIPAMMADNGKIYSKANAEHGDITHKAESVDGATFTRPDAEIRGWMLDGKFVSIKDIDSESIAGVHYTDRTATNKTPQIDNSKIQANGLPYLYDNSGKGDYGTVVLKGSNVPREVPNTNPGVPEAVSYGKTLLAKNPSMPVKEFADRMGLNPADAFDIQQHILKNEPLKPNVTADPSPRFGNSDLPEPPNFLPRKPSVPVIKAGLLNPENYLNALASKFISVFDKADDSKPFEGLLNDFSSKYGIDGQDALPLQSAIYKRLTADLATNLLSKDEISVRQDLQKELETQNQKFLETTASRLDSRAISNGMYIEANGGGIYKIRSLEDGSVLQTAGSPKEAEDFIQQSQQSALNDLDGGATGAVPTVVGKLGGLLQPYRSVYSSLAKFRDALSVTTLGAKIFTPSVSFAEKVDNLAKTTFLRDIFLPASKALDDRRSFTSELNPLTEKLNNITRVAKNIPDDRMRIIGDNVTTLSSQEIVDHLLSRPMFSTEVRAASNWFKKTNTSDVIDLLSSAKTASQAKIGSAEFAQALNDIANAKDENGQVSYGPETYKAALSLATHAGNFKPEEFSPYAVLRLAKAFESPDQALTRSDHATKYNLSAKEMAVSKMLTDYYNSAFEYTGIDAKQKLSGYLPDMLIHAAVDGAGSNINPQFARELTRVGIMDNTIKEQNPLVAARRYHYSLISHSSGFTDAMDRITKRLPALQAQLDAVPTLSKGSKLAVMDLVNKHLNNVRGIPDPSEQMSQFAKEISGRILGDAVPGPGSVMEFFNMAKIPLRFGLALRDGISALQQVQGNMGTEFAREAFSKAITNETITDLHGRGVFGNQDLKTILDPRNEDSIFGKESLLGKTSGVMFKASGQESVYNRSLAGIYMATQTLGSKILKQLQNNEITKDVAYDKLGLGNYGPAVNKIFDDYVTAGRPDKALDFLGQWNGRKMSTIFGNNNVPIGWNSKAGRFLSQYGYWATNATNTLMDSFTYGTKKQIATRLMRRGVGYAAVAAAGNALGVDLSSWQVSNPINVFPGVGPLATLVKDVSRTYNNDPDKLSAAFDTIGGLAAEFIPFSQAYKDWKNAYDSGNPWAGVLSAHPE